MKVEVKAWSDTKNVDMTLIPETSSEASLLVLLKDRQPRWSEAFLHDGKEELIFEPGKVKR